MLLDDFSVIEYKDENISQNDLRTVLRMFADIVQEVIRPKDKKKKGMLDKLFKKKEKKEVISDEQLAREAITHDLYQQHEHLQDEEVKVNSEKKTHESIIHPEAKENKETNNTQNEEKTIQNQAFDTETNKENTNTESPPAHNFAEEVEEQNKARKEDQTEEKTMWTGEEIPEFSETKKEETTNTEELTEADLPSINTETESKELANKSLEEEASKEDLASNISTETSWIADAPSGSSKTEKTEEEDEFPFQPLAETKTKSLGPKEEYAEHKEEKTKEQKPKETNFAEEPEEKTKTELTFAESKPEEKEEPPSVENNTAIIKELNNKTLNSNEFEKPTESVTEDLNEVSEDMKVGYAKKEESEVSTDLKDLAAQLKEVIKREHLEGEYEEKTALSLKVDNIQELIDTAERLIVEKDYQEAKNVYQEIMGKYNQLGEEEKHQYYDKIQLLFNLLSHK